MYEYYLLVQSHFLKVLALVFTPNLWALKKVKIQEIFLQLNTVTNFIEEKRKIFEKEYNRFQNFGTFEESKVNLKISNTDLVGIRDNFYFAGIHLHQLLGKIVDAQKMMEEVCVF